MQLFRISVIPMLSHALADFLICIADEEAVRGLLHLLDTKVGELLADEALVGLRANPLSVTIQGVNVCEVTRGWGEATLLWAVAHTVFALKPICKGLLYLLQERCLGIGECAVPPKVKKVLTYCDA